MLKFCGNSLERMCKDAVQSYPGECCGILLGQITEDGDHIVKTVRPQKNSAPRDGQGYSFEISPQDLMREEILADRNGAEILGFYHSHPDEGANASDADLTYMIPGMSYPVLAVLAGRVAELRSYKKELCVCEGKEKLLEEPVTSDTVDTMHKIALDIVYTAYTDVFAK